MSLLLPHVPPSVAHRGETLMGIAPHLRCARKVSSSRRVRPPTSALVHAMSVNGPPRGDRIGRGGGTYACRDHWTVPRQSRIIT